MYNHQRYWEALFKNPFNEGDVVTVPKGYEVWPVKLHGKSIKLDNQLSIEVIYRKEGYYWGEWEQGNVGYWDEDGNTALVPMSQELLEVNDLSVIMQDPPA